MKIQRVPTLVLMIALLIAMTSAWAFYTSDGAAKAREREARLEKAMTGGRGEPAPTLEVSTVVASTSASVEIVELAGVLEPIRSTWVAAEIAGRILEIPAEEHSSIGRGDLLVELDASLPQAELIRAQANHLLAKSELSRQEQLGSRSVASEAELDQAKAEERRSFAALLEARTRLDHTRISAPFDGLVNSLDLDPGAYVQPGTPIAEILDLSRIEITVLVGDRQVSDLRQDMDAAIRIDALGSEHLTGRITHVAGAPRDGGQRYPVVVLLDNSARRLRPGMLAHVLLEVGSTSAIRVPTHAVQHEFELDYVFVLDENDAAHRVRVTTRPVPFRPDRIEIREGLAEGDRVAVTAIEQLRNGMRVIAR
ncbi:MAG: efflux RND transporter periplasmic adaptor subunit [bacterium]|nr:efflux RND transporter periplasmic adaptor subunit [bacterium]